MVFILNEIENGTQYYQKIVKIINFSQVTLTTKTSVVRWKKF